MYSSVRRCFALVLMLAFAGSASAQQGPPKPGDGAPEKRAESSAAPFVYERYYVRVRIEPDGKGTRELTWQIRVNDDTGVRQAGQIPVNYAPECDTLTIAKLEVRKPGGRTIVVGPEAIQDHAIQPFAGATMFFDLRQKMITVPSLQSGDTILLTAVWSVERPLVAKQTWYQHSFIKSLVAEDERLEIDVPEGYPIVLRTASTAPAEERGGQGEVAQGRRIYRWKTSNLKLPAEDEDEEESAEAPVADIRLTTFREWAALADWFRPLLHPGPDASVRAKAQELTASVAGRDAKIRAIYGYVATQIRYVSLSFGLGRFSPHTPAEVLRNQYGDCKDKHALLAAMLDAIGVPAVGVLINTTRSVSNDMPSPAEFDHVITAIPSGEDPLTWLWLDTTAEIAPPGLLVAELRDKQALFLGPRSGLQRLVKTPADGPFPFVVSIDVDGDVNPLGVLVARLRMRARGDVELVMRSVARALPRAQVDEYGKGFFKALGFKGDVSDVKLGDPLATAEPYEMSATLREGGFLDWAAAKSSLVTGRGGVNLDGLDAVKADQLMGTPVRGDIRFHVRLPPGYTAVAPSGVTLSNEGFEYRSTYSSGERSITIERAFVRKVRKLEVKHAPQYAAMDRTIDSDLEQGFAISSERRGVPQVPEDMKAGELYSAGYSAYNVEDYETAAVLWKRAAEVDPKMATAWSGLGFAYQKLKRYDDAIAAMEKQIELDPSNKRIHTDLGFVAKSAGKLDVAARAYKQHIELNPLDAEVHRTLGEIHLDLEDYSSAIRTLEKAASLKKEDRWTVVLLGSAHLRSGQVDTAMKAFDRAVEMDPSPAVWTKVGWELAKAGVQPAKAADLLARTTSHIVRSTTSLRAADIDADHYDLMSRLAWSWDAKGLMALKKKDEARAILYFDAAWRLGGAHEMAEHLGEAYEAAPNRSSDALTAYLIARSLPRPKATGLDERIKRLAGTANFEPFMKAAREQFMIQRSVLIPGEWPEARAEFSAILDRTGRVTDSKWLSGDDRLRELETKVRGRQFPLEVPDAEPQKLAVKLRALCNPKGCGVVIVPARDAQ